MAVSKSRLRKEPDPRPNVHDKLKYLRGVTVDWFESGAEDRFQRITTHRHEEEEAHFAPEFPQGPVGGKGRKLDISETMLDIGHVDPLLEKTGGE